VITKSIPVIFSVGITLFFVFIMYMIMKNKPKTIENNKGDEK